MLMFHGPNVKRYWFLPFVVAIQVLSLGCRTKNYSDGKDFGRRLGCPISPASHPLMQVGRWFVSRLTIECASCGQSWMVSRTFSLYEQQAVESCPCPRCSAYTLCCHEPPTSLPVEHPRRFANWQLASTR